MNMTMGSALPDWVTPVAWIYITVSLLSAALISADIVRRRNHDIAAALVWITSALYLGPLAIPAYLSRGRVNAAGTTRDGGTPQDTVVAALPGGGASAVAHLIAVPLVVAVGWTIAGLEMWPMIIVIAVLAIVMLTVYERAASRTGRTTSGRRLSVGDAVFAALVTVVAFDVGMVGWMLLLHLNDLMPPVSDGSFWFLMQLGVIVGLATGYPAVKWLLGRHQVVVPA
jgi:hypothetical protein